MRSKLLLLVALTYFVSGLQILMSSLPAEWVNADPSIQAHLTLLTVPQIGWLFVGMGVFGLVTVLIKKPLWGYFPFMYISTLWCLLYFVSWYDTGYWRSVFGALLYVLFIGILLVGSKTVELPSSWEKFFKDRADK